MLQTNTKPTFLVDAMLGNIAKKLRLLGYDSEYSSNSEDEDLIIKAKNENRILITKDLPLSERAKKQKTFVISLINDKEIEQLAQIFKNLEVSSVSVSSNNARCAECNGKLEAIEKENIMNRVPEGVFEKINNFWKCSNCNRIYWEGTHIQRLQKFVNELNEKL
ncbi:MAG TPA: Mut7-C RNAse domain-containing protein [Nitrosopumilaceae archaeon]|nr:Mut7-C RNAse domain-containing protein [Nitrosopumilaceae archaeon]